MTTTNNSQNDTPTTPRCVARRHIPAAAFKTYDALMSVAMAAAKKLAQQNPPEWKPGDPLPTVFVSEAQLGNMNNRNEEQEREAIQKLVKLGWVEKTHEKQRRWRGRMTNNDYRVRTHDEFLAANPKSCPPDRYVIVDENHSRRKPRVAGTAPWPLERHNIIKAIGVALPDRWLAAIAGVRREVASGTDTGNPVTVADYGDVPPPPKPDAPTREIPRRSDTGNPATVDTGNPATVRHGKSRDIALVSQLASSAGTAQSSPSENGTGSQEQDEKSNTNTQTPDVTSKALPPLTDQSKTLGQHFDLRYHPDFDMLAPGLSTETKQWQEFDGAIDLQCMCYEVITDFAEQPYCPNESEAFIMSIAMSRFNAAHGEVPRCWVKVMKDLQRADVLNGKPGNAGRQRSSQNGNHQKRDIHNHINQG
jgi:hypothetical protein